MTGRLGAAAPRGRRPTRLKLNGRCEMYRDHARPFSEQSSESAAAARVDRRRAAAAEDRDDRVVQIVERLTGEALGRVAARFDERIRARGRVLVRLARAGARRLLALLLELERRVVGDRAVRRARRETALARRLVLARAAGALRIVGRDREAARDVQLD